MSTDEFVLYDTQEKSKVASTAPIFRLVPADWPTLYQKLPEFDFKNPPVNPTEFASSLVETCKANNGLGLSANQCGYTHRVFVMGTGEDYVAFFNPELISSEGESHMDEGCLSFPLLTLKVTRPKTIHVKYQDFKGETHTKTFEGLTARCFLHELDHMNGIMYTFRTKPLALQLGIKKMIKMNKKILKFEKYKLSKKK
jgi:peptide deformylase